MFLDSAATTADGAVIRYQALFPERVVTSVVFEGHLPSFITCHVHWSGETLENHLNISATASNCLVLTKRTGHRSRK